MRDELQENFKLALAWCWSNELHMNHYQDLISVDIAPVLDLSVHITAECAERLELVNERPLMNGGSTRWVDDDGIQIVWIAAEVKK